MTNERALTPITDIATITRGLSEITSLGQVLAQSGYFKDASDPAKAVVKVLYGQELGVGPIQAMMGIHVIEGKPAMSAGLMSSLIKASGRYTWRVLEHTDKTCRLMFLEKDGKGGWMEIGEAAFSMEDAARAGLTGRDPWKKYPKNMMFARALSNGARWYCADVFGGAVYEPDELSEDTQTAKPERGGRQSQTAKVVMLDRGEPAAVEVSQTFRERLEPAEPAPEPAAEPVALGETNPNLAPISEKNWGRIVDLAAPKGITFEQIAEIAEQVCGIPADEFDWQRLTHGQGNTIYRAIKER